MFFISIGKTLCVCLKGEVKNDVLSLNCKISDLRADVEFYKDGSLYGSCPGPTENSNRSIVCSRKDITQNLDTNITTVVAKNKASFTIYGSWECKHGENLGEDALNVTEPCVVLKGKQGIHLSDIKMSS